MPALLLNFLAPPILRSLVTSLFFAILFGRISLSGFINLSIFVLAIAAVILPALNITF